jgi:2-oxoglutarate dehydrogenase E1 component
MTQAYAGDRSSFLTGSNAAFLDELYHSWSQNPAAVSSDWQQFFNTMENGTTLHTTLTSKKVSAEITESGQVTQGMLDSLRALMMIRTFRVRGHLIANLDPLNLEKRNAHPEVDPATYNFGSEDYDRPIFINNMLGLEWATLAEILEKLRATYCGTVGVEYMHIQDSAQKAWIQERVENTGHDLRVTDAQRLKIVHDLTQADAFEHFLHVKFAGEKRFGLEGGESLIPALEAILAKAAHYKVENVVFGTAHRGRLCLLATVLKKPLASLFAKFLHRSSPSEFQVGSGDVKYHMGFSSDREIEGSHLHLSLTANPSHLEAVNPVALGKVRAEQSRLGDTNRNRVMALLIHGDAAFAGQGLVAETLELSSLKGFRTGGTVHIIINNQIGFTTSPPHSRSSPYSSDIAKCIQAPIFHVNADDPEAVVWVASMAADFQREFGQDVVVDMVCYRRYGHNEIDEPSFTQPKMYQAIANHPSTLALYALNLIEKGLITSEQVQEIREKYEEILRQEHDTALKNTNPAPSKADWLEGIWTGIKPSEFKENNDDLDTNTGVAPEILLEVAQANFHVPDGFHIHPRIARLFEAKRQTVSRGTDLDWATGEALAIGSLLLEDSPVRLSGQDCGRGTFSQRHAIWVDQETEQNHIPLNNIRRDQKTLFQIVDSPLAEASVLGFEYGYSLASPHSLVMWEAQFGDFANGAQVIIDQFISSGELKWLRLSGLVMLLPHGHEGQGPEHTSARLERFLQLCAESNMRVANCSTPANFFHILRRQVRTDIRKPLILMTPKSLLRHPKATSTFEEMATGTHFLPVIPDAAIEGWQVRRVILCSGKVYYDLLQEREKRQIHTVALVRLEQFYPFPYRQILDVLSYYKAAHLVWCQEEPKNMGAWTFLEWRLEKVLKELESEYSRPVYVGRASAASPATGILSRHQAEQEQLIANALNIDFQG